MIRVLVVPPGSVSVEQCEALLSAEVHVIEHPDPGQFRLISPEPEPISSSAILRAAMGALNSKTISADDQRIRFTQLVAEELRRESER